MMSRRTVLIVELASTRDSRKFRGSDATHPGAQTHAVKRHVASVVRLQRLVVLAATLLLLVSTAGTAPASAASKLSVSYPRSAAVGTTITIAGRTSVSRATNVSVQRAQGGAWKQLASAKLRRKQFSLKVKLGASIAIGTTRFRVTARRGSKTLAKSKTLSIKVVAPTVPGASTSAPVEGGGRGSLGGDYPDADAVDCSRTFGRYSWCKNGTWLSPRRFGYRNCTDYAAWVLGITWSSFSFPTSTETAAGTAMPSTGSRTRPRQASRSPTRRPSVTSPGGEAAPSDTSP